MREPDKIAPSILSADFARLGEEVRRVEAAGADLIHFDVMDGHFVPNLSIGIPVLKSLRKVTRLPLDAHLMIENPEHYIAAVRRGRREFDLGARRGLRGYARRSASQIRSLGARASIGINPETAADRVLAAAEHLDMILVMSVHPGFGGQEFIPCERRETASHPARAGSPRSQDRRRDRRRHQARQYRRRVAAAGANVFVSGSGIFGHPDYAAIIAAMRDESLRAGLHPG